MKTFLRFESRGDKDNQATRKKVPHERGQKRLRGWADACAGDSASLLQSPLQGLHGGSLRDDGKKPVCHRPYRISCQARSTSHGHGRGVKRLGEMTNGQNRMSNRKKARFPVTSQVCIYLSLGGELTGRPLCHKRSRHSWSLS